MGDVNHLEDLKQDPENARKHNPRNIGMITSSLHSVGAGRSIVIDEDNVILSGNGVYEAAVNAGIENVQVVDADGETIIAVRRSNLTPEQKKKLAYFDNRTAELADWSAEQLLADLEAGVDLGGMFFDSEIEEIMAGLVEETEPPPVPEPGTDKAEELQAKWQVSSGDIWQAGEHFVICGDCREPETWERLLAAADVEKVNGFFTSPPYAEQRKQQYGGVPVAEYVEWWEAVQANVRGKLADDGSFFVNIKPHCEDGQRVLYVFDLVLAMARRWGWRFVDELCWTHQGFPGEPQDRFQNAFEPVHHYAHGKPIKFRPDSVSYESDSVIQYSTGLNIRQRQRATGELSASKSVQHGAGKAYPRNVLRISSASTNMPEHAAAFPVALPDFFIRAYSDPGDVWLDPFLGSGTTICAAHQNDRRGLGIEKLEKYVSVTLERLKGLNLEPQLQP